MSSQSNSTNLPARFGAENDIVFTQNGTAIDVRITRPKALNSLTHNMALALYAGLQIWREDGSISHVIISADASEKRAFCAGGDIRDLYAGKQSGDPRHRFFRDEYRLNDMIATFPKPYIALLDGLVMGGGAGMSIHGSQRIVTENTRFAMPEVGIGLIPDVGGTFFLPRLKKHFGWFLGLSGITIGPEECLETGLATHYCDAGNIEALRAKLTETQNPIAELQQLRNLPNGNRFSENAAEIDDIFSASSLQGIFSSLQLQAQTNPLFLLALTKMQSACPLSLCLAFEQFNRGVNLNLRQALITEYQLVSRILLGPDLYEGIRAAIIDRSTPAKWQHPSIAAIDNQLIASFFSPPPEGDLTFENV